MTQRKSARWAALMIALPLLLLLVEVHGIHGIDAHPPQNERRNPTNAPPPPAATSAKPSPLPQSSRPPPPAPVVMPPPSNNNPQGPYLDPNPPPPTTTPSVVTKPTHPSVNHSNASSSLALARTSSVQESNNKTAPNATTPPTPNKVASTSNASSTAAIVNASRSTSKPATLMPQPSMRLRNHALKTPLTGLQKGQPPSTDKLFDQLSDVKMQKDSSIVRLTLLAIAVLMGISAVAILVSYLVNRRHQPGQEAQEFDATPHLDASNDRKLACSAPPPPPSIVVVASSSWSSSTSSDSIPTLRVVRGKCHTRSQRTRSNDKKTTRLATCHEGRGQEAEPREEAVARAYRSIKSPPLKSKKKATHNARHPKHLRRHPHHNHRQHRRQQQEEPERIIQQHGPQRFLA